MCAIADVLHEVPHLVSCLRGQQLSALRACNKELQKAVNSLTQMVTVYHADHVETLIKYEMPRLSVVAISLKDRRCSWPCSLKYNILAKCNFATRPAFITVFVISLASKPACSAIAEYRNHYGLTDQRQSAVSAPYSNANLDKESCTVYADSLLRLIARQRCECESLILYVRDNILPDSIMAQLLLGKWPKLTSLSLSNNTLGPLAIRGLASASLPQLSCLSLARNALNNTAMTDLAQGDWPKLAHLNLGGNKIDSRGLQALTGGRWNELTSLLLDPSVATAETYTLLGISKADEKPYDLDSHAIIQEFPRHAYRFGGASASVPWPQLYHVYFSEQ